ncbi:50S ribosomal protein L35 [Zea mays]|uniref:50S ribosomal protein L35 n=1 Tax=Zea mays TaxID=4577 RepID=A0A1D6JJL3_MAIZE|nr:50S ribosomal protein L35 [Zea mays]
MPSTDSCLVRLCVSSLVMASVKRFRVTRKDKIMRRCAGKQHLLAKKNTKRKKRLSKMEMFADLWAKGFSLLGICLGMEKCHRTQDEDDSKNPPMSGLEDAFTSRSRALSNNSATMFGLLFTYGSV